MRCAGAVFPGSHKVLSAATLTLVRGALAAVEILERMLMDCILRVVVVLAERTKSRKEIVYCKFLPSTARLGSKMVPRCGSLVPQSTTLVFLLFFFPESSPRGLFSFLSEYSTLDVAHTPLL